MEEASPSDLRRLYADLSWTWPILSPKEDYVEEASEALEIIREHARIPVNDVLHLGCGGGHIDFTLKKSVNVTGVDISESMLGLARRLNPEVTYVQGDMRTVRLDRLYDAVAVLDSIDYMLTHEDLLSVFATARIHLRPGGVFLTCAEETTERFRQNRTRCTTHASDTVVITFLENAYDPDPTDTAFENTFVHLIRREGHLEVETDRHECGLFPFDTWVELLRGADFEVGIIEPWQPRAEDENYPWFVGVKPA